MKNINDKILWDYHQTENADHLIPGYVRQEYILGKINDYLKSGKVLEIGFGNGYLLGLMDKENYETYGADISKVNVENIREKLQNTKISLMDTDGVLPYDDEYFNGFIASEVFEHMDDKELEISVKEMTRVIKKGAKAILTFPAEENLEYNECFCPQCGIKFHRWGHKQSWNKRKIKDTFRDFEILEIKEYYNRFVGKSKFENSMGIIMQKIQTILNYFIKFPNKIYHNRIYVIVLEKK